MGTILTLIREINKKNENRGIIICPFNTKIYERAKEKVESVNLKN